MFSRFITLLIVALAAGSAAFHSSTVTNRISRLHQERKLKQAPRVAPSRGKVATSTTYVTLQGYDSVSCSGDPFLQETFVTGVCFPTALATETVLSGMYVWDSDTNSLYIEFYTDIACSVSVDYYDYITAGYAPNVCNSGIEIETASSMPSVPSAAGVKLDAYTSSSSCDSDSDLLMEYWLSDSNPFDDDNTDDMDPFADDNTYNCDLLTIPNYSSDNEVNFTIAAYVTKSDTSESSSSKSKCFAGSETVQLENGNVVPVSSVVVGDRVLAADAHGRTKFSTVIAVPHDAANTEAAQFIHLAAASGKDIKMTPEHLVAVSAACDGTTALMEAGDVKTGMCLMSVHIGVDKVVDSKVVHGKGVHTLVTEDEMVVVNGFVASPFAVNHAVANAYYNIIRMLPSSVVNSRLVKQASAIIGSLVTTFSR